MSSSAAKLIGEEDNQGLAISLKDFLRSPQAQPPTFLVEEIVPREAVVMLSAAPGAGKTMFAMDLGLKVAAGQPFLGRKTEKANILLIGEDAPPWDYAAIARKLLRGAPPPAGFYVIVERGFQLLEGVWRQKLEDRIRAQEIGLVVVDTLRAVHGLDENDSAHMQQVMNALRAISIRHGATVLFLHHTSKANQQGWTSEYRGSSVILGSCDYHIFISASQVQPGVRELIVRFPKGRGTATPDALRIELSWNNTSAALRVCRQTAVEQMILARLARGSATIEELVGELTGNGKNPKTNRTLVDKVLKPLLVAGAVDRKRDGQKYIYELPGAPVSGGSQPQTPLRGDGNQSPAREGSERTSQLLRLYRREDLQREVS